MGLPSLTAAGSEGGVGRHVVDRDSCLVLAEAAVLVDDPGPHGVDGRTIVKGAHRAVGAAGGAGVGSAGQRAVVAGVGVVEAGAGVGRAGIELAGEVDGRRAALVHRSVVGQAGGGIDVVD